MADQFSAFGKAAQGVAHEAFRARVSGSGGGKFLIDISCDRAVVKDALIVVSATAVTLSAIYAGYKLLSQKMDGAVNRGLGGERDDQQVGAIEPRCLHVRLHCFTDERFLEVLEDYDSGRMKDCFQKEFSNIGIEVEGLTVKIENWEEVKQRKLTICKRFPRLSTMQEMSGYVDIFVPVPQKCMGIIIGAGGRNINQLKQETQTRIQSCREDKFGRGSGFTVTGTTTGCEAARLAIQRRIDNYATVNIKEPVPQEFVRLLIRKQGSDNFRGIENQCGVKITWPKFSGTEKYVTFDIIGLRSNCDRAKEMLKTNVKRWEDNEAKSVSPGTSLSPTHSKVNDDVIKIDVHVPKEYIGFVMGKGRKNIEIIETKSGTKIKVPFRRNAETEGGDTTRLEITGPPKNCVRAQWLIRHRVIASKDKIANKDIRYGFGGNTQFVCFDFKDENENFELVPDGSAPKLDGFIQGPRYRIKSETDDDSQGEISDKTITTIKKCLLTSLEILNKSEDEKHMIIDLWCHFGKVFVSGVDEEKAKKMMTPADISERLMRTTSSSTLKNKDTNGYWKVSFEEGVDPLDDSVLPNFGDENHDFFGLKLDHIQWRYDFGFITPSYRNVRLKAWEGLPPDSDEKPPIGVKNILTSVALQAEEGIKAWICYPSVTVLRGEIMTPNSEYDCRLKLRTGSRYVADEVKDGVCIEEDAILSKYLFNCKFDNASHSMDLPDEKDHEMPEGFGCMYYREAEERIFSATVDGERFTVTVLGEKGWDSDLSDKRDQNQFGIRVAMDSWSEALLSPERNWTPEEILDKLKNYMDFLSLFKNRFLDG